MGLAIFYLLLICGLAFIPAGIASGKGYSFGGFYLFGVFFFLPALVVALVLEDKNAAAAREEGLKREIRSLRQDLIPRISGPEEPGGTTDPICWQCGHDNATGAVYCTKCGTALALLPQPKAVFCPKCRAKVTEGDEFCANCGWNVSEQPPASVLVSAVAGDVRCPACGAPQQANRSSCYKCGTNFEYR